MSSNLREYSPINTQQQEVDDLVVTCSDHRFQHAFSAIMSNVGISRADKIVYPGPSAAIANGTLLPAIQKLEELHSFTNVHILDHTDCGAFGGLEAYNYDEEEEAEAHFRKLEAARSAIHDVMPHLTVVRYVVGIENEIVPPERQTAYQAAFPEEEIHG